MAHTKMKNSQKNDFVVRANLPRCYLAIIFPLIAIGFGFFISMIFGYSPSEHYERMMENLNLSIKFFVQISIGLIGICLWIYKIVPSALSSLKNSDELVSIKSDHLYIMSEKICKRSDIFSVELITSFLSESLKFTIKSGVFFAEVSYSENGAKDSFQKLQLHLQNFSGACSTLK
jgi:hypothetical protein